eukprot:TRINITY_DN16467_c0_g1_i1.p2 TRINITY_DN16467_c0_g1~~TRINITY_DN16467_c0_g1_i1.p2  ORF type:complete len:148 (+),score=8.20 TRINITY_DN16467_c0_g1_i1:803-1246(+)
MLRRCIVLRVKGPAGPIASPSDRDIEARRQEQEDKHYSAQYHARKNKDELDFGTVDGFATLLGMEDPGVRRFFIVWLWGCGILTLAAISYSYHTEASEERERLKYEQSLLSDQEEEQRERQRRQNERRDQHRRLQGEREDAMRQLLK